MKLCHLVAPTTSTGFLLGAFVLTTGCSTNPSQEDLVHNDLHSRLNETRVAEYHEPRSSREIVTLVKKAKRSGRAVSISGGRHAMGGQQFGEGTIHLNLLRYNQVISLDPERGLVTVESGIQWPELIEWLLSHQEGRQKQWGIRQKQTGADRLSIGGALSANIHGRGLTLKPMVGDVESFTLVDAEGEVRHCSREDNAELFRLVIGGYGLFGVIAEVTLRLSPRQKLIRKVEVVDLDDVPTRVEERIQGGYLYGDYQFKTDEGANDFLRRGVFSFYKPVGDDVPESEDKKRLDAERWVELYKMAHTDKPRAFGLYTQYYMSTDGQIYWTDTHQLSEYEPGHDGAIDQLLGARAPGSLMICEYYVSRSKLPEFVKRMGAILIETEANLIYGTVRFIDKDDETFLAWAREPFACTVINLRVTHDEGGIEAAKRRFRAVTDLVLDMDGSYFLTYHRWATKEQVLRAYPQFPEFIRRKLSYDPDERFQSEWYRHYRKMFADQE